MLHLLYSRFWHKWLYDLGHVSSIEPYYRLFTQGYILALRSTDEREIFVESTEVVERDGAYFHGDLPVTREWGQDGQEPEERRYPDDICSSYGSDTLRLYEIGHGSARRVATVGDPRLVGIYRFLQRLWLNVIDEETAK